MVSNALSSRRRLLRRPKVCAPGPKHGEERSCPSTLECLNLKPAPLEYSYEFDGATNGPCGGCGNMNRTHKVRFAQNCIWEGFILSICPSPIVVSFGISPTDSELILFFLAMLTTTYRGPKPADLFDIVTLTKLSGPDFCDNMPSQVDMRPVCN